MSQLREKKIVVIDDDTSLLSALEDLLRSAGATVCLAEGGPEGVRAVYAERPDLVVLDLKMLEMDGWEALSHIKAMSDVPVILLSGLHSTAEVVRGLESGAVDYITKPFDNQIFLARVGAALRQAEAVAPAPPAENRIYDDGFLHIDLRNHLVNVASQPVALTAKEYGLLAYLFGEPNQIHTFQQILHHVWGWEFSDSTEYVHVYISRLRKKIEPDARRPRYLLSEHGIGYQFHLSSLH